MVCRVASLARFVSDLGTHGSYSQLLLLLKCSGVLVPLGDDLNVSGIKHEWCAVRSMTIPIKTRQTESTPDR